jgi:hypothetical protein
VERTSGSGGRWSGRPAEEVDDAGERRRSTEMVGAPRGGGVDPGSGGSHRTGKGPAGLA